MRKSNITHLRYRASEASLRNDDIQYPAEPMSRLHNKLLKAERVEQLIELHAMRISRTVKPDVDVACDCDHT